MSSAIRNRSLLPVLWAMIAAQSSLGNAEIEPRRLTRPTPCVNLLPPEAIERERHEPQALVPFAEGLETVQRAVVREGAAVGQTGAGSAIPFPFSSQLDRTKAVLLIACAGLALGGLALAFLHRRVDNHMHHSKASSVELDGMEILKPLIASSLPLFEEPLILPRTARLHGRPIASERYRQDAAHSVNNPHFPKESRAVPLETDVAHWISAADPGVKEPSYRRFGSSAPERDLATVEGGPR